MGFLDKVLDIGKELGQDIFKLAKDEFITLAHQGQKIRELRESGASEEEIKEAARKMRR